MEEADKKWLIEEFPKYRGRALKDEVLNAYYIAEKLLKGNPTLHRRGCTCEYSGMANEVHTLHNNFIKNA